jgi:hypothetical protein
VITMETMDPKRFVDSLVMVFGGLTMVCPKCSEGMIYFSRDAVEVSGPDEISMRLTGDCGHVVVMHFQNVKEFIKSHQV